MFCQALLAGLATLLYFVTRPAFAAAYAELPGSFPFHTRLSLTSWYLPGLVVLAVVCDAAALVMPKRSMRNAALGAGLILPALGLALAVDGIFVPLFQVAPGP